MRIPVEEAQPVRLTPEEYRALSPQPNITLREYACAVVQLTKLAQGDTGGSLAAAQVLLSAYNSNRFQLAVVDLCNLDTDNFAAAIQVIKGRKELSTEPHTLIADGVRIFQKLADQWHRYNIDNRHRTTCHDCYGSGRLSSSEDGSPEKCNRCDGSGYQS